MTGVPAVDELTPVARTLLDFFQTLHPVSRARIVAWIGGRSVALYPADAEPIETGRGETAHLANLADGALRLVYDREATPAEEAHRLAEALRLAIHGEREARSAARELSDRYEEINLLYSISEISGSVLATEDAAARILAEILDVLSARRASIWLFRPDPDRLELAAGVGEQPPRATIDIDDPDSTNAWVFRENQPLNLEREPNGHGRAPKGRPIHHDGDAFLSVPIHYTAPGEASRTVGVLTLVGGRSSVRFSASDERLLTAVASQIGAALETHRLLQESLGQERLLRELELAHDLQLKLLPVPDDANGAVRFAARCLPAESVGGDFYQFFRLSDDRLGVLIGDVSGHGFPAALIMTLTISAIGIYAQETERPAEVLRRVHRALIRELESTEMYLSLFYAVLDPAKSLIRYANAGHPQAYRIGADGSFQRLGATGPPLGTVTVEPYGERTTGWDGEQDILTLFTDGLSDTFAAQRGSAIGEHRLLQRVAALRAEPLNAIVDDIFTASDREGSHLPPDDRTLVLVRA
jgi:sigma-B regulation protein RsbU (phosphoserine phosphatase)